MTSKMIIDFLLWFQKSPSMFIAEPDNYTMATSFIDGFLYCCFLEKNSTRHFYWAMSDWYQKQLGNQSNVFNLPFSSYFNQENKSMPPRLRIDAYIDAVIAYFKETDISQKF